MLMTTQNRFEDHEITETLRYSQRKYHSISAYRERHHRMVAQYCGWRDYRIHQNDGRVP